MPTAAEKEAKAELRAKAKQERADTEAAQAKNAAAKARATKRSNRKKAAEKIGDTIVLASEEGNITPQLLAEISKLMAERKVKLPDWDLVERYFPQPAPAKPVAEPDAFEAAAE